MSAPVFVSADAADAAVGSALTLAGAEARHALAVQRRAVGEVIDLVDGAGARARARIVSVHDGILEARVEHVSRDDDPRVTLVQALAKGGRDEQAVEAATELGITGVVPWAAERSIVQWRGAKAEKALAQWRSLALAAAKQSRRALIPQVDPMVTSRQLAEAIGTATAEGVRVLVLHESAGTALASLTWADDSEPVWIIVGPEGGITDAELAGFTAAGAVSVRLGVHVLRASSAGPAAIAALATARGTWATA